MYCKGDLSAHSLFLGKNKLWEHVSTLQADLRGSATTKGAAT
jgi:hypothetical protein